MSINPVAGLQPNRSAGFLFRNPFKTLEAFTESDLGIRIGFSRITKTENITFEILVKCQVRQQLGRCKEQKDEIPIRVQK